MFTGSLVAIVTPFRKGHGARQVGIRIDCALSILLTADRTRLIQVFVNLLTNACDASRPGDKITVQARLANGGAIIEVIDAGEGMAQDLLDRVFEPFVTTKGPRHGTGLGLSVVYRIVKDHGGSISIDSRPGDGTRVVLTLPGAEHAEEVVAHASAASPGASS